MNVMQKAHPRRNVWMTNDSCSLEDFKAIVEVEATGKDYPLAAEILRNVPIYDAEALRNISSDSEAALDFMAEWHEVFLNGPGIAVFRRSFTDIELIDRVSDVLLQIIADESRANAGKGDHFGKAGANARVWNSHEKLCMIAPDLYTHYSANNILALVSRSWLGPLYQITAQVNLVYPGGKPQTPHRDYHMGFQQEAQLRQYPSTVHRLSAALTLQGAIAHCDMPLDSGPTKLLPYSQCYLPGYFATHRPEFRDYFEKHYVQLPLNKGDTLFFNPAVFHAAGSNTTADIKRLGNLLQIGSGYGRSIEIVDRARMTKQAYPMMLSMQAEGRLSPGEIENLIAATAEGYPFPCNLDVDSPLSGMAPPSQQDILRQALQERWDASRLNDAIDDHVARRVSH